MADEEGWVTVSQIGNHLTRTHASFDPRNFGHSKLTALVQAQPYLETRGDAKRLEVRLKAPRKSAPAKTTVAKKAPAAKKTAKAKAAPEPAIVETPAAPAAPKVTVTTRTRPARKAVAEGLDRVGLHELRQRLELAGVGRRDDAVAQVEDVPLGRAARPR